MYITIKTNRIIITQFLFTIMFSLILLPALAQVVREAPEYETEQIKEVIEQMIEAHGGFETWAEAPSIKFDNVFFNTSATGNQNPWWISTEIIEQVGDEVNDRRVFQHYHIGGAKGDFSMGYNGDEVWATTNWAIGNYPKFMNYFFYYFLNLPWLTQDDVVTLSNMDEAIYNNQEVITIEMGFKESPAVGKTALDSFKLFIDKRTKMLVAYEYSAGFGAQLDIMGMPKDRKVLGPVFRHIDEYKNVGGLIFPTRMHTTNQSQSAVYGHHSLINYSISTPFDESKSAKPDSANVDISSAERASE